MANVWVSRKCIVCGKQLEDGELAVLAAWVKTTPEENYGNYRGQKSKLRVNFYGGSPRGLMHMTCAETTLPKVPGS